MVLCRKTPHPRDGAYAWFVCFCSAFNFAVLFGTLNCFGVILPVWSEEFGSSRGETAWIGSLQSGVLFLVSPLAIKFNLQYSERIGGICSSIGIAILILASSFATKIAVLFVTHGVLLGVFISVIYNADLFVIKKWFKKRLGVAFGVVLSGGSAGIMSFNAIMQLLIETLGWRNAFRVLAAIWLLAGLSCVSFTPNVENDQQGQTTVNKSCCNMYSNCCSLWRSGKYIMGMIVIWTTFFGYYTAMIHVVSFAKDHGIPGSKSSLLFIFIGACSTIARLTMGKINDKDWLSPMQSLQLSAFIIGSSLVPFTQAKEYYHFIIFAVYYGLGNGAFITAQNYFLMTCFGDFDKDAQGYGMGQVVKSIPIIVGAPISGFIADYFKSYVPAFYICGGVVLLSSVLPFSLLLKKKPPLTLKPPQIPQANLETDNADFIETHL